MNDKWDFLLSEFRRLGGIADNICQKEGRYGRGIFSINPALKSRIFTPAKLLIKTDDIYLEDNKLRIKKEEGYSQEIRNFFNFYQDNFSWGSGGRETTEIFERGLSLFNQNLKELIKNNITVDIGERHKGEWNNVVKTQFLNARAIKFKGKSFIAPVWELVNHKVRSLPFNMTEKGVITPNYPPLSFELRHSYGTFSPLNCFFSYGFFSDETIIFSVPFLIKIENHEIYCKGMDLKDDKVKIERLKNKIILEGLPIADLNHPKLPYNYFDEIIRKINHIKVQQDILLKIFELNISIRKKIIDESQLTKNQISKTLRQVLNYENSLIRSHN